MLIAKVVQIVADSKGCEQLRSCANNSGCTAGRSCVDIIHCIDNMEQFAEERGNSDNIEKPVTFSSMLCNAEYQIK